MSLFRLLLLGIGTSPAGAEFILFIKYDGFTEAEATVYISKKYDGYSDAEDIKNIAIMKYDGYTVSDVAV